MFWFLVWESLTFLVGDSFFCMFAHRSFNLIFFKPWFLIESGFFIVCQTNKTNSAHLRLLYMTILSNTASSQTWSIIPRFQPVGTCYVTMRSEAQNKITHTLTLTGTYANGRLTLASAFSPVLVLNNFYTMEITEASNDDTLIYRGRVFVTDQTDFQKFTVNNGAFTEYDGNNNEFIVIA